MRRERRVKIVATLGPSSSAPATIEALVRAGADVFRINMSHASHDRLRELVGVIRQIEGAVGRPLGILADLQGPKLRIGNFAEGSVILETGRIFVLDDDSRSGDAGRVHLPHREVLRALEPGHQLLLDDGKLRFRIAAKEPGRVLANVEQGGRLSDRKGVSLPDTDLPVGALTEKDRSDLEAALNAGVDWVALSFIQRPDDVAEVRKVTRGRAGVLAKIEKPLAVQRLDEILELSDALMVARGDLGVEMPLECVPGIQKHITRAARRAGKPVIVATQMLESMISSPVPTRAEVSDVATAVFEGADAVMLSAESAAGKFPVEAVATMDRIAVAVERDANFASIINAQRASPEATGADAIAAAARQMGETLNLAAIVCYTSSGSTGLRVSRERPRTPIVAISPRPATVRRLSLVWGLHCVVSEEVYNLEDMVARACQVSQREGFARPGQRIIVTCGVPFGTPGTTNMLRLAFASAEGQTA